MFKKIFYLTVVAAVLFYAFDFNGTPKLSGYESIPIDVLAAPVQHTVAPQTFEIKGKADKYTVTTMASYHIAARIMSKADYWLDWNSDIAPVDLALAWGKLTEPRANKYVRYWQDHRWYYFHYTAKSPYTIGYIYNHSANNHLIPANDNVRKAIKRLKAGQDIVLDGYLVSINSLKNKKTWVSSMSREDEGNGACELVYVTGVRVGNNVYR